MIDLGSHLNLYPTHWYGTPKWSHPLKPIEIACDPEIAPTLIWKQQKAVMTCQIYPVWKCLGNLWLVKSWHISNTKDCFILLSNYAGLIDLICLSVNSALDVKWAAELISSPAYVPHQPFHTIVSSQVKFFPVWNEVRIDLLTTAGTIYLISDDM